MSLKTGLKILFLFSLVLSFALCSNVLAIENNLTPGLHVPTHPITGPLSAVQSQAENYSISVEPKEADANFNGLYYDQANDLLNLITLSAGISVRKPGNYSIEGSLYDVVDGDVVNVANGSFLSIGSKFIDLNLVGMRSPGPYRLRKLLLFDEEGAEIDQSIVPYSTRVYNDLDFSDPKAKFDGNYSDYGSGFKTRWLYDYLTVDVGGRV